MTLRSVITRAFGATVLALSAVLPAQAAYVYQLDVQPGSLGGHGDFTLTVNDLLLANTSFALTDFDAIDAPPGTVSVDFEVLAPNDMQFVFNGPGVGVFFAYAGALQAPGTYCSGFSNPVGCAGRAAVMTITEVGAVPEPGSLALLGAAAVAAAVARRRQTRA